MRISDSQRLGHTRFHHQGYKFLCKEQVYKALYPIGSCRKTKTGFLHQTKTTIVNTNGFYCENIHINSEFRWSPTHEHAN